MSGPAVRDAGADGSAAAGAGNDDDGGGERGGAHLNGEPVGTHRESVGGAGSTTLSPGMIALAVGSPASESDNARTS